MKHIPPIIKKTPWIILKNSWLVLAVPVVASAFLISTFINWEFGRQWGGVTEFIPAEFFPFIPFALTGGAIFGGLVVALGWFQSISMVLAGWAFTARRYYSAFTCVLLGVAAVAFGVYASLGYQAAAADLMERTAAMQVATWGDTKVKLARLRDKSHEIAPRSMAVIRAERQQLLHGTVRTKSKTYQVAALTKNCSRSHWAARGACDKVRGLDLELAHAKAYASNQIDIEKTGTALAVALVMNTDKFFAPLGDAGLASKEKQIIGRSIVMAFVIEAVNFAGVPLILFGLWYVNLRSPDPDRTARDRPPLSGAGGGALRGTTANDNMTMGGCEVGNRSPNNNVTPMTARKPSKAELLARFVAETRPRGWFVPDDFVALINEWSAAKGFNKFSRTQIGMCVGQGDKMREYVPKSYGSSPLLQWRFDNTPPPQEQFEFTSEAPQRKAA